MRILFCSPNPLRSDLGAPKVLIEVARALEKRGWSCTLTGPDDLPPPLRSEPTEPWLAHAHCLRRFLLAQATHYEVVDYDHVYLPFPRAEFAPAPLFVARSVLLAQHLETITIPARLRTRLKRLVRRRAYQAEMRGVVAAADRTVREADLVNVSSWEDRDELVRRGVPPHRIAVLPFGMTAERYREFAALPLDLPARPAVAFVGTFDPRKGALDFPRLVRRVADALPEVRFRLLGTRGMVPDADGVLRRFPRRLRDRLQVEPSFPPERLPELLRGASVGVFPSYMEGFGFGVLEMLAAGLPVVAYRAPGVSMMLPGELLVPPGDIDAMADRVVKLLHDPAALAAARRWARERAGEFGWQDVARDTEITYLEAITARERTL